MKSGDLIVLRAELDNPAYAALSNADAAAAINAPQPGVYGNRQVNYRGILAECPDGGVILDKLETATATFADLKWAMYGIKSEEGINIGDSKTQAQIDLLEGSLMLSASEAAALRALAPLLSFAQERGWPPVKESEVKAARALP